MKPPVGLRAERKKRPRRIESHRATTKLAGAVPFGELLLLNEAQRARLRAANEETRLASPFGGAPDAVPVLRA